MKNGKNKKVLEIDVEKVVVLFFGKNFLFYKDYPFKVKQKDSDLKYSTRWILLPLIKNSKSGDLSTTLNYVIKIVQLNKETIYVIFGSESIF